MFLNFEQNEPRVLMQSKKCIIPAMNAVLRVPVTSWIGIGATCGFGAACDFLTPLLQRLFYDLSN